MTRAQEFERLRERIVEILEEFPGEDNDQMDLEEVLLAKISGFLDAWDSEGGLENSFIFFKALIEHPCQVKNFNLILFNYWFRSKLI